MDETDNKNEELKGDLHGNTKVKVPVVEKPDDNALDGSETVKDVNGISSDLECRSEDKSGASTARDSLGLNSVLEYTSKIRAFIGLQDDANDVLPTVKSPGIVDNTSPDEHSQLFKELDENVSGLIDVESKPVCIENVLSDQADNFSNISTNESDLITDDNENLLVDNEQNILTESTEKNESSVKFEENDISIGNEQGISFEVDKNLSDHSFNEILRCADKGIENRTVNDFKVDESNINLLENSDVEEDQINNNETIPCNILIKNNDSQKLIDTKNNSLDSNINESDAYEIKVDCKTIDNTWNSSENLDNIVVDQPPLYNEN